MLAWGNFGCTLSATIVWLAHYSFNSISARPCGRLRSSTMNAHAERAPQQPRMLHCFCLLVRAFDRRFIMIVCCRAVKRISTTKKKASVYIFVAVWVSLLILLSYKKTRKQWPVQKLLLNLWLIVSTPTWRHVTAGNSAGSYFVSGDRRENVLLTLSASHTRRRRDLNSANSQKTIIFTAVHIRRFHPDKP